MGLIQLHFKKVQFLLHLYLKVGEIVFLYCAARRTANKVFTPIQCRISHLPLCTNQHFYVRLKYSNNKKIVMPQQTEISVTVTERSNCQGKHSHFLFPLGVTRLYITIEHFSLYLKILSLKKKFSQKWSYRSYKLLRIMWLKKLFFEI